MDGFPCIICNDSGTITFYAPERAGSVCQFHYFVSLRRLTALLKLVLGLGESDDSAVVASQMALS